MPCPISSRFQSVWPIGAQFPPGLETVTESNTVPEPVKSTHFYGHTGYRILDTGTPDKGPSSHHISVRETRKTPNKASCFKQLGPTIKPGRGRVREGVGDSAGTPLY